MADGDIAMDEFVASHVALEDAMPGKEMEFFDLLARAIWHFDLDCSACMTIHLVWVLLTRTS